VALLAAQQYMAAHREQEGYELFRRLAREQPDRPILLSLEGMMQARWRATSRCSNGSLGRGRHPQARS